MCIEVFSFKWEASLKQHTGKRNDKKFKNENHIV